MTTKQSMKRRALLVGCAAILTMGIVGINHLADDRGIFGNGLTNSTLATHAGVPLAPGDSGGEITRGNESGSFAPTSTNDLVTPWSPTPGSPYRD